MCHSELDAADVIVSKNPSGPSETYIRKLFALILADAGTLKTET